MSKTVQWKRGNTTLNSTYIGAEGEITINTDTWNLHVHDGMTAGGYIIDSSNGGASFSNLTVTTNITAGNITSLAALNTNTLVATGNITGDYFIGNGSQLTGITTYTNANVVNLLSNFGSNTIETTGNITGDYFIGNGSLLTGVTSYSNADVVSYGETGWSGNIIPSANNTYSLGNITNQWANLWVSNNTIYLGNIAIGVNDSNVLTVNGQPTLSNNSNTTINTDGNITAGNLYAYRITGSFGNIANVVGVESLEFTNGSEINGTTGNASLGNITASGNVSGNYFVGNGSFLTGITAGSNYTNSNVVNLLSNFGSNTIVTTGNITGGNIIGNITITGNVTGTSSNVELVAGAYTWTFNNAGNLVLPGNTFAVNYANGTAVTLDTVYLLEAYANVTYTLPGSFTEDPCRYSIVSSNVNVSSSWFNTSTYTFTPQQAGYWEITASYDIYRNTESSIVIKKNNSVVAAAGSFNAVVQQITKIIYLNGSTDYIDIVNVGGAALSRSQSDTRSWFQARWIGE